LTVIGHLRNQFVLPISMGQAVC